MERLAGRRANAEPCESGPTSPTPTGVRPPTRSALGASFSERRRRSVTVPNEAVQWDGCCSIVFVRDENYFKADAPKVFHVRKVRTGATDTKNTEIIAGALPGELVVTKGSGLLLTELLRGNLGAGCACCPQK